MRDRWDRISRPDDWSLESDDNEVIGARPAPGKMSLTQRLVSDGRPRSTAQLPGRAATTPRPSAVPPVLRSPRDSTRPSRESAELLERARAGTGETLPVELEHLLAGMLSCDLGEVRIHTDSAASEAAQAIRANAFTVGKNIYFAAGKYQPDSPSGQKLLAHEVAHAVQSPRAPAGGGLHMSTPDAPLEREAHAFADRFASHIDGRGSTASAQPAGEDPGITPAASAMVAPQRDEPASIWRDALPGETASPDLTTGVRSDGAQLDQETAPDEVVQPDPDDQADQAGEHTDEETPTPEADASDGRPAGADQAEPAGDRAPRPGQPGVPQVSPAPLVSAPGAAPQTDYTTREPAPETPLVAELASARSSLEDGGGRASATLQPLAARPLSQLGPAIIEVAGNAASDLEESEQAITEALTTEIQLPFGLPEPIAQRAPGDAAAMDSPDAAASEPRLAPDTPPDAAGTARPGERAEPRPRDQRAQAEQFLERGKEQRIDGNQEYREVHPDKVQTRSSVSTDAGPRPVVQRTGAIAPATMAQRHDDKIGEVSAMTVSAHEATEQDRGENDIEFTVATETVPYTVSPGPALPAPDVAGLSAYARQAQQQLEQAGENARTVLDTTAERHRQDQGWFTGAVAQLELGEDSLARRQERVASGDDILADQEVRLQQQESAAEARAEAREDERSAQQLQAARAVVADNHEWQAQETRAVTERAATLAVAHEQLGTMQARHEAHGEQLEAAATAAEPDNLEAHFDRQAAPLVEEQVRSLIDQHHTQRAGIQAERQQHWAEEQAVLTDKQAEARAQYDQMRADAQGQVVRLKGEWQAENQAITERTRTELERASQTTERRVSQRAVDGERRADDLLSQAEQSAGELKAEAHQRASDRVGRARSKAHGILGDVGLDMDGRYEANAVTASGVVLRDEATGSGSESEDDEDEQKKKEEEAKKKAEEELKKAAEEAQRILDEMQKAVEKMIEAAKRGALEEIEAARAEIESMVAELEAHQDAVVNEVPAQFHNEAHAIIAGIDAVVEQAHASVDRFAAGLSAWVQQQNPTPMAPIAPVQAPLMTATGTFNQTNTIASMPLATSVIPGAGDMAPMDPNVANVAPIDPNAISFPAPMIQATTPIGGQTLTIDNDAILSGPMADGVVSLGITASGSLGVELSIGLGIMHQDEKGNMAMGTFSFGAGANSTPGFGVGLTSGMTNGGDLSTVAGTTVSAGGNVNIAVLNTGMDVTYAEGPNGESISGTQVTLGLSAELPVGVQTSASYTPDFAIYSEQVNPDGTTSSCWFCSLSRFSEQEEPEPVHPSWNAAPAQCPPYGTD